MGTTLILLLGAGVLAGFAEAIGWAKTPVATDEADTEDAADEHDRWTSPDRWLERGESHPPGQEHWLDNFNKPFDSDQ